ncbi:hypothetical protein J8L98_21995 [Pseudoalteromonas sp. MMG013]|uniref:hypothetical protein n=1 Tax=Pseudoalteromonas sp. MMG013 TaxID=2822687 RepID=UPI001B385AC2|nr:hypothetical protein [Pseudoalteromonas sp. MMG013]MBQ4864367.1 hypothetical protein [Pseudoalteromonas sp. MMG013]
MEIRKDLEEVSPYIARLLSFSKEFSDNNKDWGHLKNQEDFKFIHKVPDNDRHKVEALYCGGRDMAIYMASTLAEVNYDFTRFPTLTSIVEGFNESWVNGNYDPEVPDTAIETCKTHDVNLWSVNQMYHLFKRQEKLLSAIRGTLNILKNSDLYKLENGIEIMSKDQTTINVSGNSSSSININSDNATASVSQTYNEPDIFNEIISEIKSADLDDVTKQELIDNTQALAVSHESGTFSEAYKDFMQNVSAHITVFTPFLAGLSALL